jgi:hypothetical protein
VPPGYPGGVWATSAPGARPARRAREVSQGAGRSKRSPRAAGRSWLLGRPLDDDPAQRCNNPVRRNDQKRYEASSEKVYGHAVSMFNATRRGLCGYSDTAG